MRRARAADRVTGGRRARAVVVAMRTRTPRASNRGTASTTLRKLSGPRAMSLTSGRCESSEICSAMRGWSIPAVRSIRSPPNSVPLVSTTIGRWSAIWRTASGSHGSRNVSPPVTPTPVNPSCAAWRASSTSVAASSSRRGDRGDDSVRQYRHARLQW